MAKANGMEFMQETIILNELSNRLADLSLDGWEFLTVVGLHSNAFELGEGAHCLIILKRPNKNN